MVHGGDSKHEEHMSVLLEIVRNSPAAVAVFDRRMHYLAHSEGWLPAHGDTSGRSVTGMSHYDVFPQIREEWRAVHRRCLEGASESSERDYFELRDGRREYMNWRIVPWHDAAGAVGGIAIYVEVMTEHVETRRRLGEQTSTISDFFSKSPIGLNLCRMDGLWLQSNPAFLDIIGYTSEEADGGLTYWQLTPRKYDRDEAAQLEALRTTRRYGPYEKEFIRKDGSLVPVRLNGFLVEHEGQTCIWSLIEDLTAQRELERKVEEQRLAAIQASKLATLGEMAAGLAHEINNPLGIIELNAYALERDIEAGELEVTREALGSIRDAVARAGKIVQGLRKFSRQTGQDPREPHALGSIVDVALDLCRPRVDASGASLAVELASNARVDCSALEISQVIVNLLNNAVDAVRGSPSPWIRLRTSDDADGTSVLVLVEDSGPKLAANAADTIFRAFYTSKKAGEGTGLGLSISRSIAEAHGGSLTLDTDAPCTRFVLRLPRMA